MDALWPRYSAYSADEIKRGLARSRFIFAGLAFLLFCAALFALANGSVPVIFACSLGVVQNLLAWFLVSKKHSRVAATALLVSNVLVSLLHIAFLQPDSAISIALSIYCLNMLRACIYLRKIGN